MNEDHHLIFAKGKDNTENIESCTYKDGRWLVKYKNNHHVFQYNYENIKWYKNPKIKDPTTSLIYENNHPVSGITKILDFGEYVKLNFKTGYKKSYQRSRLVIEDSSLTNSSTLSTFNYLKTLANYVSVKDENDKSFLSKQYENLTLISPRSVLASYLKGEQFGLQQKKVNAVYPFGFNISQKLATEKALSNQVSIIEGPPGTGKTQTILNIIANAVMENKTVAVVSNNNSATANVLEKLEKYGVDFIAAYLGNNQNKAQFFANQKSTYPDMSKWGITSSEYNDIQSKLRASQNKLNEMLGYQNNLAIIKQELSSFQTEYEYFIKYYEQSNTTDIMFKFVKKISSDKALKLLLEFKQNVSENKFSLKDKIYNLFFYGIFNLKFYKLPPEELISFLQKVFYEKKIQELNTQIELLLKRLENYSFEEEMKEFSQRSMDLFKAKLAEKYKGGSRTIFSSDALWKDEYHKSFLKEYPVTLSTSHSLRNSAAKNYLFDYVIIDEASQVDIATGALALSCAKNVVIVGDVKQLPNVVSADIANKSRQIFETFGVVGAYSFANHSLLSSFIELYRNIPKTLLKEHYRCHPKIIGFCNQKFYNNELIVLTNQEEENQPLVLYKTAKGNHARGKLNQRQIDVVFNEVFPDQKINEAEETVGIISPFRLQAEELQKTIGNRKIDADTVHKFQGRERDVIILTTVVNYNERNAFADNSNLINVAISRAVKKLIVVVSEGSEEWNGTNIGDLVRYIQYHNFEVIESQIYSVFDLLYSSYSEKLLEVMRKSKKVSNFKSENLMNTVIGKVLNLPEYQSLDWVLHQPLRMLIKDPVKLTEEERTYAMNILSHTDFVIFNKHDKMPVLVVEVDGHAYHANNPVQLKRDKMKDEILRKYGIPIIRMKTTGSMEENRLNKKLEEIFKIKSGSAGLIGS
ncbi:AAA domain-containing protein [Neobacillus citreus]|uniref:AAA domain-containing protein n=1 Tax=Neobacillus citreus TaxID=2833578 RepID=A0A942YBX5_9BACI|nr:AAA domain-containing protein [Neobacillus citreus]MCH6265321.1 AAA domain-containing protein [Neobacillus citreus]